MTKYFFPYFFRRKRRDDDHKDFSMRKGASVLSSTQDATSGALYRPKTLETRQTYEVILNFIQDALGDQVRVCCHCVNRLIDWLTSIWPQIQVLTVSVDWLIEFKRNSF